MADINGERMFNRVLRAFRGESQPNYFRDDYTTAVNAALRWLYTNMDLTSEPTLVTDAIADIDFDDDYEDALFAACVPEMMTLGHAHGEFDSVAEARRYAEDTAETARTRQLFADRDADTDSYVIAKLQNT